MEEQEMTANTTITTDQLHSQYIRLAKIIHPDHNPNEDADEKFQELQEQYEKAQKLLNIKTNYQASISVTLKESILGTERFFVTDEGNRFVLMIPAGVKNHQTIQFRGLSLNSVKSAILHIKVYINIPSNFSIIGENLILNQNINFFKLYFGGKYEIIGPDGKIILVTIPKKTKNGKMFRIQNAGLWNRIEKKREPLYIQFFGSII
jgi:DnaJ-class molecular chaperone